MFKNTKVPDEKHKRINKWNKKIWPHCLAIHLSPKREKRCARINFQAFDRFFFTFVLSISWKYCFNIFQIEFYNISTRTTESYTSALCFKWKYGCELRAYVNKQYVRELTIHFWCVFNLIFFINYKMLVIL